MMSAAARSGMKWKWVYSQILPTKLCDSRTGPAAAATLSAEFFLLNYSYACIDFDLGCFTVLIGQRVTILAFHVASVGGTLHHGA